MPWRQRWGVVARFLLFYRHLQYMELSDHLHTVLTVLPWLHPGTSWCTQLDWLRYWRSQELLWLHSVSSRLFCVWTYLNTTSHTTLWSVDTFMSLSSTTMETGSSSKPLLSTNYMVSHTTELTFRCQWNPKPETPCLLQHISTNPHKTHNTSFYHKKHSVSSFKHVIWKVSTASVEL